MVMKVTVGLASHRSCATDFSGLSTYGLNVLRQGDEHPALTPVRSMAPLYLYLLGPRHCTAVSPPSLTCVTGRLALDSLVLTVHEID